MLKRRLIAATGGKYRTHGDILLDYPLAKRIRRQRGLWVWYVPASRYYIWG